VGVETKKINSSSFAWRAKWAAWQRTSKNCLAHSITLAVLKSGDLETAYGTANMNKRAGYPAAAFFNIGEPRRVAVIF
jgi:hypothetical protein